jgi:hypothetical protein
VTVVEAQTSEARSPTYGELQAMKILAADELGLQPSDLGTAKDLMQGRQPHAMLLARMEREAVRIHNLIRGDVRLVQRANEQMKILAARYGLSV